MIYNKQGSAINLTQNLSSIENTAQNDITREINAITEIDRKSYTPYVSTYVSGKKVRQHMRRIKKKARRVSYRSVVMSSIFSMLVAVLILYLSYNKIYAPESVCSAAVRVFESLFVFQEQGTQTSNNTIFSSGSFTSNSTPIYLSSSTSPSNTKTQKVPSSVAASTGQSLIPEKDTLLPDISEKIISTTNSYEGKSGSDGKVYHSIACSNLSNKNLLYISNQTKLSPDTLSLSQKTPKAYENIKITSDPLVLILHTHATESYTNSTDGKYDTDESTRSDDTSKNVVAVGEVLANTLQNFGIPVLHSKTLHDKESFINAYTSSLNEANRLLNEYPSIKFVIDLHRDSIMSEDGTKTAPTVKIAGENYAQLMFVIGTNEAGFNHPNWQDNLCFALDMQKSIDKMYPSLMRPINLRSVSFNEQLSSGYVLLETGSCASNISEAKRSAEAFGSVLAKRILENAE